MIDFNPDVFGRALTRLWPHGDAKIPGVVEGIIKSARGSVLCPPRQAGDCCARPGAKQTRPT